MLYLRHRIALYSLVVFAALFCSVDSYAIEEARLLPKGISRFRAVGVTASTVDSKFNSAGRVDIVGGANVSMDVKDIAATLPTKDKAQLLQLVDALNKIKAGSGDSLFNVNTYQDIAVQQNIYGAAYEYGLSDRWNIGVRLRVVQNSVKSSFSAQSTDNIRAIQKSLAQGQQVPNATIHGGLQSVQQKLSAENFTAESIFAAKGYEFPGDSETTDLGYTEVGAKYLLYKDPKWLLSTLWGVRIPTGKDESLTNPLDRGTGGNHWGIGGQLIQNFSVSDYISLAGSVKVDYYLGDAKLRAVPLDENDALPSLLPQDGQVQEVRRKVGTLLQTELAVKTKIPSTHFTVAGAYQYKQKGVDKFEGSGDLYYSGLSRDTNYKAQAMEAQVGFNTIQLYRQGKFRIPLAVEALYNQTFAGMNTPKFSYTRLDLKLYF